MQYVQLHPLFHGDIGLYIIRERPLQYETGYLLFTLDFRVSIAVILQVFDDPGPVQLQGKQILYLWFAGLLVIAIQILVLWRCFIEQQWHHFELNLSTLLTMEKYNSHNTMACVFQPTVSRHPQNVHTKKIFQGAPSNSLCGNPSGVVDDDKESHEERKKRVVKIECVLFHCSIVVVGLVPT